MARAYKHQEFLAHSGEINCLQIGRKSGRVLVTGGDDRKVNMWAIGKPNCIMSLTGHTSAVECVAFDTAEESVVAGSAGGTLKLWDLEQQKVVRNMVGHRCNCISLDFHPYGDFFASGSSDTNLKVWDVRRKSCISTYKGHTRAVTVIKFSPDGRWLCSGSEDGTVKLWDLAAGKLMENFTAHEGPITCLDFHPTEYMLSTAATDRTVKFWDLETFSLISSAEQHATPVRSMTFAPDGSALLAGAHESLKVWGWEPVTMHDQIDVSWNKVSDMKIVDEQLLSCSYSQSFVAVWIAEVSQVRPFSQGEPTVKLSDVSGSKDISPIERIQAPPKPLNANPQFNHVREEDSPRHSKGGMAFEVRNPKALDVPRTMPKPSSAVPEDSRDARGAPPAFNTPAPAPVAPPPKVSADPWQPKPPPAHSRQLPAPPSYDALSQQRQPAAPVDNTTVPVPKTRMPPPSYGDVQQGNIPAGADQRPSSSSGRSAAVNSKPPPVVPAPAPAPAPGTPVIPKHRGAPLGLDISAFLPGGHSTMSNDDEILGQVMDQHLSMCGILNNRLTITQAVYTLWAKGDLREAILLLAKMNDPAVVVDVLTHAQIKTAKDFTLDMAVDFLPLMQSLLASRFEDYIVVALEMTNILLKGFSSLIKMTRAVAGSSARGEVDISKEERLEKCNKCYVILQQIQTEVRGMAKHDGRVGTHAQELLRSFDSAKL